MTGATQNMNFLSIFTSSYVYGKHKNNCCLLVAINREDDPPYQYVG